MYHNLPMPFTLGGHLLHTNNAAVDILLHVFGVHIIYYVMPLLGTCRRRSPSQCCKQFSKVMEPFWTPFSNTWELLLLQILYSTAVTRLFSFSHSSECLVISHCGFNVYVPHYLMTSSTFSYVYCPFGDPLLWVPISSPFFYWVLCCFIFNWLLVVSV